MKILLAFSLTLVLLLAAKAASADPLATGPFAGPEPFSAPGIFEAHDKFPHRFSTHDLPGEHECSEPPDGDGNCDDPVVVPEPGAFGSAALLVLGVGGVLLRGRRRRE